MLPSGGGLKDFFGDGSDGVLNTTGNLTLSGATYEDVLVKQYESVSINTDHQVTIPTCGGTIFLVNGDVTIDGTINGVSKASYLPVDLTNYVGNSSDDLTKSITAVLDSLTGGNGGSGGKGGGNYSGSNIGGSGGSGRTGRILLGSFGGGGGGGSLDNTSAKGGNGGAGDSLNRHSNTTFVASKTNDYGASNGCDGSLGQGGSGGGLTTSGKGGSGGASNGAGGGGGGGAYGTTGTGGGVGSGSGAFFCIIAKGNITISASGLINCSGGNGGTGGNAQSTSSSACGGGGGGGGAGGGTIAIFHKGTYTNLGTLQVDGGSGGSGGAGAGTGGEGGFSGTSGSVGTIHTQQL